METNTSTTTTTTDSVGSEPASTTPSTWEKIELGADRVEDSLERIVHEATVRRIVVKRDDKVIAEFPLAAGVVGALLAAPVAGIAAIVALVSDCTIEDERVEPVERVERVEPVESVETAPSTVDDPSSEPTAVGTIG